MQYSLVLGLIGIVALLAITRLGGSVQTLMTRTANTLQTAGQNTAASGGGSGGGGGPAPTTPFAVGNYAAAMSWQAPFTVTAANLLAATASGGSGNYQLTGVTSGGGCTASLSGGVVTLTASAATSGCGFQVTDTGTGGSASGAFAVTGSYPASCVALKAAGPALADGTYTIQPAATAFPIYCDMDLTIGGVTTWALIVSPQAYSSYPGQAAASAAVALNSNTYLPLAKVQDMVGAGTTVLFLERDSTNRYAISKTSVPATRLDAGLALNNPATSLGTTDWTLGSGLGTTLDYDNTGGCMTQINARSYPSLYWCCNNSNGLHYTPYVASASYGPATNWSSGMTIYNIDFWVH